VTIGTLALFRGFAYILLGDKAVADFPPEYAEFGIGNIPYSFIPSPFVLFIVLALVFLGPCFITPPLAGVFMQSAAIKWRRVSPEST